MPAIMMVVAAALIDEEGRVLVQRRPAGKMMAGLWEFPGGKIEPGETPESALVRELGEELGITVDGASLTPVAFASEPLAGRHMLLLLYICHSWAGSPRALDAEELLWRMPESLRALDMPPADRPLIGLLEAILPSRA
ncbi:MAG: (deoxy)nucleoside triphosphate pyrophosphohydrolase [Sphingomonas sp.]